MLDDIGGVSAGKAADTGRADSPDTIRANRSGSNTPTSSKNPKAPSWPKSDLQQDEDYVTYAKANQPSPHTTSVFSRVGAPRLSPLPVRALNLAPTLASLALSSKIRRPSILAAFSFR